MAENNDSDAKNVPLPQLANEAYTALFDYADEMKALVMTLVQVRIPITKGDAR